MVFCWSCSTSSLSRWVAKFDFNTAIAVIGNMIAMRFPQGMPSPDVTNFPSLPMRCF